MAIVLAACAEETNDLDHVLRGHPQSMLGTEGAVCSMVVSEQPAPRAQVLHRDGTRLFLCGIADLLIHLDSPSPHGMPVEIYVEAMEIDEDPREISRGEHEWIRAESAIYRIGDERPPIIMGAPVMVYRDREEAGEAISHGPTVILEFEELQHWWRDRSF